MNGVIKKLTDKGFGFITQEGSDNDVFFHSSELQGVEYAELQEGDNVTFEITEGQKGPAAVNVTRV